MISDVLSEAVQDIDRYLQDPTFERVYAGSLRTDILALRDSMDRMRVCLDRVPTEAPTRN